MCRSTVKNTIDKTSTEEGFRENDRYEKKTIS